MRRILIAAGCIFLSLSALKIYTFAQEETAVDIQAPNSLRERLKILEQVITHQRKNYLSLLSEVEGLKQENISLRSQFEEKARSMDALNGQLSGLKEELLAVNREKAVLELMAKQEFELKRPPVIKADDNLDKSLRINLGYAYGMKGQINEAIEEYRRAEKLSPQDKDIHYNLGHLLLRKSRFKEAAEEFNKALSGGTEDKEIYYNLAVIYSAGLKDSKTSREYYNKSLSIPQPDNLPVP